MDNLKQMEEISATMSTSDDNSMTFMAIKVNSYLEAIVRKLKKDGKSVATAESCTGGNLSARITSVSGASEVFSLGVCTYTNEQKNKVLGVRKQDLENYSAVSSIVAVQMAQGILRKSNADYAIATTGYAGPGGGTTINPVGTVYIAVATKDKVFVRRYYFSGDRGEITFKAVYRAFELLVNVLDGTVDIENTAIIHYEKEGEQGEDYQQKLQTFSQFMKGNTDSNIMLLLGMLMILLNQNNKENNGEK